MYGYALEAPTNPDIYHEANIEKHLASSIVGDVRDINALRDAIQAANPQIIINMAAQSLVRQSYLDPVETFETNLMGTVNLFTVARVATELRAIVNVTSDKCYENREWIWPYRETDHLGGYDPYSSSKACAEIATSAYRQSFYRELGVGVASARAGNVVGGGDWARDRLIPDFLRAMDSNQTLKIRSPGSIRPWQHVLEPLSGYLQLAEKVAAEGSVGFSQAWNFGPDESDTKSVEWIVDFMCTQIEGARWEVEGESKLHEAHLLTLDSSKARSLLGWAPRWRLDRALSKTIEWHNAWKMGGRMDEVSLEQIQDYESETI